MSSAARVTVFAAKTCSVKDSAALLPAIRVDYVNTVSTDLDFVPQSDAARSRVPSGLPTTGALNLMAHGV